MTAQQEFEEKLYERKHSRRIEGDKLYRETHKEKYKEYRARWLAKHPTYRDDYNHSHINIRINKDDIGDLIVALEKYAMENMALRSLMRRLKHRYPDAN